MPHTWLDPRDDPRNVRDMDLEDTVATNDIEDRKGCLEWLLCLPLAAMDPKDFVWAVSDMLTESKAIGQDSDTFGCRDACEEKGCLELLMLLPFLGVMYYVYQILSG